MHHGQRAGLHAAGGLHALRQPECDDVPVGNDVRARVAGGEGEQHSDGHCGEAIHIRLSPTINENLSPV